MHSANPMWRFGAVVAVIAGLGYGIAQSASTGSTPGDAVQWRSQENENHATLETAAESELRPPEAAREASVPRRDSQARSGSSSARGARSFRYALPTEHETQRLIREFPDISSATRLEFTGVGIASIPDELLQQVSTHGQRLESLVIGLWNTETHAAISDVGMEYISRLQNLKQLCIACRYSGEGFQHLSKLVNLDTLGSDYPTITAKEFFETASKMPAIKSIGINYAQWSQPIDDETFKAIASLNGRLESLSFGEWQETTIHASILPAIAEIESLTVLDVGCVEGSLPPEQKDCLARLPYLERMTPVGFEVVAMEQFRSRDTFPVEFRPVKSPSGMMALLKYLLGDVEAAKVRREVVRRRAGISALTEDFTQSRLPVSQILNESFGVTSRGGAWSSLQFIAGQYRELDQQIRRYLSGMEIEPVEN